MNSKIRSKRFISNSNTHLYDPKHFFNGLDNATYVEHIATFEPLVCCDISLQIGHVLDTQPYKFYDFIVAKSGNKIVGLINRVQIRNEGISLTSPIFRHVTELANNCLISADAGVLEYLWNAKDAPARLVLRGTDLQGIVTLADLQRLPVRTTVFSMIMFLELLMTERLRELISPKRSIIEYIKSKGRQDRCMEKLTSLKKNDLLIDDWGALDFCDKRDLLSQFSDILGVSKRDLNRQFRSIEKLRNLLAHGADYAVTRESCADFIETSICIRDWIWKLAG